MNSSKVEEVVIMLDQHKQRSRGSNNKNNRIIEKIWKNNNKNINTR